MSRAVVVLGSGPIRIGQGIEFDYSCVHCVWALERLGYRAIIVNNNPETVSTDFDTGDGLYFEPVNFNSVLNVVRHENAIGVVCQFGGQTAINLAQSLESAGIPVLGTSPASIAMAEDRGSFDSLLEELGIERPRGAAVRTIDAAIDTAARIGYPILVRPSFVLGGRAMEIVYSDDQLRTFYALAEDANPGQPVLVDQYISGIEAEVDVISDGVDTLVPGIMEHIERAGVHSGDSMAVYPPVTLTATLQAKLVLTACRIARALKVKGLMNIQFVVRDEKAFVLEVNPRASRTVPYLSKVTGIPMVDLATQTMMGKTLSELGYSSGLWALEPSSSGVKGRLISETALANEEFQVPDAVLFAVKAPVFSFQKLRKVEPSLGPEMKSTGEIMGLDNSFSGALYKAFIASGVTFKGEGAVLITVRDEDKAMAVEIGRALQRRGYSIVATSGTHDALVEAGIESRWVMKISEGEPNLLDMILKGDVSLMINSPSSDETAEREAALIRRACIETGVPCVTSIDTASALSKALDVFADPTMASCKRLDEYFAGQAEPAGRST